MPPGIPRRNAVYPRWCPASARERGLVRPAGAAAVEHAAQRGDDLGVELGAGVAAQLLDRERLARRPAVRGGPTSLDVRTDAVAVPAARATPSSRTP